MEKISFLKLRSEPSKSLGALLGGACIALLLIVWYLLTCGSLEARILSPVVMPSPGEAIDSLHSLWFDRELSRGIVISLLRVGGGFFLAAVVAVPLGFLAGSYFSLDSFLKPLTIFGRNIPMAALVPLTMMWFGLGEASKVMFIFLSCVAFVLVDASNAARAVSDRFLDLANTLGAKTDHTAAWKPCVGLALGYALLISMGWFLLGENTALLGNAEHPEVQSLAAALATGKFWLRFFVGGLVGMLLWWPILTKQVLRKVVFPLALPHIFTSLRVLFGLAFGYIMLAEMVNAERGLGAIINMSQRRGPSEHIYLILIIISLLAWGIDRLFLWLHNQAFPYLKHDHS